jgi:hypothetical protein
MARRVRRRVFYLILHQGSPSVARNKQMPTNVLVAGSGKIAQDLGLHFLKKGNAVSWASRHEQYLISLQGCVDAAVREHLAKAKGCGRSLSASFYLYDEIGTEPFDLIVECTTESIDDKREVAGLLSPRVTTKNFCATTSRTIAPTVIHPSCIGFVVGYPLEYVNHARVSFPVSMIESKRNAFITLCSEAGIRVLLEPLLDPDYGAH